MKTNLHNVRFITWAFALAAVLVTQPMSAVPMTHTIVITENSSTSLTVTYDGNPATVTFNGPNSWTVTLPSTVQFSGSATDWSEPENVNSTNGVVFEGAGRGPGNTFFVTSDTASPGQPGLANGTFVTVPGSDTSNGGSISATMFDNGDVATAPDTGSTFALLFLSLVALFGASRLRYLRFA
jgi:hypothetical protein